MHFIIKESMKLAKNIINKKVKCTIVINIQTFVRHTMSVYL